MLSLFLFAPMWGRLSDRHGRRVILLIGLTGFGATMLVFAFVESLVAVYAERILSGLFAAAVTPVALAAVGDLAATDEVRARRLTFVSLAGVSGISPGTHVRRVHRARCRRRAVDHQSHGVVGVSAGRDGGSRIFRGRRSRLGDTTKPAQGADGRARPDRFVDRPLADPKIC